MSHKRGEVCDVLIDALDEIECAARAVFREFCLPRGCEVGCKASHRVTESLRHGLGDDFWRGAQGFAGNSAFMFEEVKEAPLGAAGNYLDGSCFPVEITHGLSELKRRGARSRDAGTQGSAAPSEADDEKNRDRSQLPAKGGDRGPGDGGPQVFAGAMDVFIEKNQAGFAGIARSSDAGKEEPEAGVVLEAAVVERRG
jgi:hypothetical protein